MGQDIWYERISERNLLVTILAVLVALIVVMGMFTVMAFANEEQEVQVTPQTVVYKTEQTQPTYAQQDTTEKYLPQSMKEQQRQGYNADNIVFNSVKVNVHVPGYSNYYPRSHYYRSAAYRHHYQPRYKYHPYGYRNYGHNFYYKNNYGVYHQYTVY